MNFVIVSFIIRVFWYMIVFTLGDKYLVESYPCTCMMFGAVSCLLVNGLVNFIEDVGNFQDGEIY